MEASHTSDPLRVLEVLVGVAVAVLAVLATLTVAGTVLGSGTVPGLSAEVCASGSGGKPAFQRVDGESTGPVGLADGVTWRADEVQIIQGDDCIDYIIGGFEFIICIFLAIGLIQSVAIA